MLERIIAAVAPQAALRRALARQQLDLLARGYDAATKGRRTAGWRADSTSQNAETDNGTLTTVRDRARDLVRNNPWGAKALRQIPADMVGTGVEPLPQAPSAAAHDRARKAWDGFVDQCDASERASFGALQHLVARTIVESGEALVVWRQDAARRLTCQVLEPDYLNDDASPGDRANVVLGGVEIDPATGRRIAYHLFDRHPGDPAPLGRFAMSGASRRVEARWVDHVFETLRPGQVRGVPWLAASALKLRDLDEYDDAELWRKKVAACLAAFVITGNAPAASPLGALSTEASGGGTQGIERLRPGTIKRLLPGEDVKFSAPPADEGYDSYLRLQLHAVAAGIGIPYALLSGDMTQANYSSLRFGNLTYWSLLDCWQWHMLVPQLLARTWRRLSDNEVAQGRPALPPTRWAFPRRRWVDPEKEAAGELAEILAGTLTWEDAVAARGEDPQAQMQTIADFQKKAKAMGMAVTAIPPSAPAAAKAPAAAATEGSQAADAAQEKDQPNA